MYMPCTVEYHFSAVIVRFKDGKSLLLQSDIDQEEFAQNCGEEVSNIDEIEECPAEYYDVAEFE
jgi:hypothetical protein